MKKIFIAVSAILSLAMLAGCSDFLNPEEYGASLAWETEEDINKALYSLVSYVSNDEAEGITGRGIAWCECCSDNVTVGRTQAEGNSIRDFKMTSTNGRDLKHNWRVMYNLNAKCNNLIAKVPGMKFSEEFKNKALGTAYFFRGFAMLWIAPLYGDGGYNGGIPIILDTTEPSQMDIPRPSSVTENYDQIISDFRTAAGYLRPFSQLAPEEYGMPHKAAAWAFAARAALYAAEYDAKYYDTVIEMCDNVINMTGADKRELFPDFAKLWRKENNFSKEYIFALLGNATDGPKYHGMSFQNGGWNLYNTWGYFQPTYNLYLAFEEGDVRREATILMPGDHIKFVGNDVLFGGHAPCVTRWNSNGTANRTTADYNYTISSDTGLTFRKFMSPWEEFNCKGKEVNSNTDNSSNTLATCLMRFADVLLMKAEALIWTKGEGNAEAKTLLGQIRSRAGLPSENGATKAELKNQRRCELAFELQPQRHIDNIRWGDAKELYAQPTLKITSSWDNTNKKVVIGAPVHYDEGRNFDPQKDHVFAIPSTAFSGTVNLVQNKGFE